jgi:tRNA (guanine37-N1)-methyltransferase
VRIDVVTLFPSFFDVPLATSLLGKAIERGLMNVRAHDLRQWGIGRHRSVDDQPYGGGAGMVMRPEPLFDAADHLRSESAHVILLSPRGDLLKQRKVEQLALREHLILLCGRYEGVDERVAAGLADEELSIGDYVLAGGEVAALVVIEAVSRIVPGVLGNESSLASESHTSGGLEYPQFTRPPEYRGMKVPEILLSGDHRAVERWRRQQSEQLTHKRRPDLT